MASWRGLDVLFVLACVVGTDMGRPIGASPLHLLLATAMEGLAATVLCGCVATVLVGLAGAVLAAALDGGNVAEGVELFRLGGLTLPDCFAGLARGLLPT